jgi:hypothetical protein
MSNDISVILNVYKRPHMIEQQIQALKDQSIPITSENIHIWYNKSDVIQYSPKDEKINTYLCNWNTKFFGRFTLPLLVKTKYVAIFDDDTIPQKDWLKNCVETIEKPETNGILGGSGVILKTKSYIPCDKVGWNGQHLDITKRVDLVGQNIYGMKNHLLGIMVKILCFHIWHKNMVKLIHLFPHIQKMIKIYGVQIMQLVLGWAAMKMLHGFNVHILVLEIKFQYIVLIMAGTQ